MEEEEIVLQAELANH